MSSIKINGKDYKYIQGQTILEVAEENGVKIPTLCWLPKTGHNRVCRICSVEVKGADKLLAACETPATEGMDIQTHSEQVVATRKEILSLLVADGRHSCFMDKLPKESWGEYQKAAANRPHREHPCPADGKCRLQELTLEHKVIVKNLIPTEMEYPLDDDYPMITRDYSRCVQCGRCASACNNIQVNLAIDTQYGRREEKKSWWPLVNYDNCTHCGECLQLCPTGALSAKKAYGLSVKEDEIEKIRTTCPYCGVGCQQELHVKDGRIIKVEGVENGEPNMGRLCVKGRFAYDFIHSKDRLTDPLIKQADGTFKKATWDEALNLIHSKFSQIIKESGPEALAGVSCARSINEDSYQMQKLFRAVFKTNNIDHCARTCHASTVAGLAQSFGSGAMTNSFRHFKNSKMFFVIGSNITEAHPVAGTYVKEAVRNGAKLIVADPRNTDIAKHAHTYVPLKVGSDVALINALMHVLIKEDLYDKEYVANFTEGFQELKELVLKDYSPEQVTDICGIAPEEIRRVAREMASVKPLSLIYTLGITEHTSGVNNVMSCANIQMLLGNVGFELGGVNPLRGQNNVQGSCDMGALPDIYPGYQKVTDPKMKEKFEKFWGVDGLDDKLGIMMPDMFKGLKSGKTRGFYIFGENVACTEPDITYTEDCLASAEFIIVQDIFFTETAKFADVVLPAAAWSENEGTFANSERRINMVRKAVNPPGLSKPNWQIFKELAAKFGHNWESNSAKEIWDNELSVVAPLFAGIKYNRIVEDGLQWPCTDEKHLGTGVMHQDGKFTRGKGLLKAIVWTPAAEVADNKYPMVLSTGRRLYHYHTRTQTGNCVGFNELLSHETADISIEDAQRLNIKDGEVIKVSSRRGSVEVKAKVTSNMPEGMVWMAFHFRENNANWLTNTAHDPVSFTAEYKACAVKIEKL